MKIVLALLLGINCLITTTANGQTDEKAVLLDLIKRLAIVNEQGAACNEHMNYFGKKALEGAVCKEFESAFDEHFVNRTALQQRLLEYQGRLLQGDPICEDCDVIVQRAEELRIQATYFLDYIGYLREEF